MRSKLRSVKLTPPKKNASSVRKLEYLKVLAILDSKGINVKFTEENLNHIKKK